jgi:predicted transglutaminase-like cysteine proteinase
MFLSQTKFSLLSSTITDDNGFPELVLSFNTSDMVTLTVQGPSTSLFSDSYYAGIHNESIALGTYHTTPPSGTYTITATDSSKNKVSTNQLRFNGANLTILQVDEDWWMEKSGYSLIGVTLGVQNTGDLPAYPDKILIRHQTDRTEALLTPISILPSQSSSLHCFVHLMNFTRDETTVNLSLSASNGDSLAQVMRIVTPASIVPPWEYQWYYRGQNTVRIPAVNWFSQYYKNLPRVDTEDYAAYVFNPFDDDYISFVAHQLTMLPNAPTKESERVDFIASFVQSITYAKDDPLNESYEYPRYPIETLSDQHGDCEDKAILTAALLDSAGYNVSLLRLPNHMAVGVRLKTPLSGYSPYVDQYYFLETTVLHVPFGQVPPEYQGLTNVTIYLISSRPLLLHTWKNATRYKVSTGADYIQIKIVVENLGTKTANDVKVRGAFYDAMNISYNPESTSISLLPPNDNAMVKLTCNVPSSIETTLKTQLILDGFLVHQQESTMHFP